MTMMIVKVVMIKPIEAQSCHYVKRLFEDDDDDDDDVYGSYSSRGNICLR